MIQVTLQAEVREDDYWDLKNRSLLNVLWEEYPKFEWLEQNGHQSSITETHTGSGYTVTRQWLLTNDEFNLFVLTNKRFVVEPDSKTKLTIIDTEFNG